jgi:hypothetical protein
VIGHQSLMTNVYEPFPTRAGGRGSRLPPAAITSGDRQELHYHCRARGHTNAAPSGASALRRAGLGRRPSLSRRAGNQVTSLRVLARLLDIGRGPGEFRLDGCLTNANTAHDRKRTGPRPRRRLHAIRKEKSCCGPCREASCPTLRCQRVAIIGVADVGRHVG